MAMDQEQRGPPIKRYRRPRLIEEDVAQIKAHLQHGKSPAILARYFEVSKSTIYDIHEKVAAYHPGSKCNTFIGII